jgi:glycosyltransferase involved in cell wall biosynthesis
MMNVLVVGHAPIRETNRDVYRALAREDVHVTLLVPQRWKSAYGYISVEPADPSCRIVSRPIRGRHHSNLYWYAGGITRIAAAAKSDVIYVDEDPAGFAAAQAAHAARSVRAGLVVLAVQNIHKLYPPPFSTIQRRVLRQADAAVTNSSQASATLERRGYRGPLYQKPLTTDAEPLAPSVRSAVRLRYDMRFPTFGYVGRLVREKGVDVFLRALREVEEAYGIVVGEGPQRKALIALAARLGIQSRIRFVPAVASKEAAAVIGALDALILPSLTRANWSEQFGRVLVEAMAAGVPVVASRSGAIPETLGDAGILVAEGRSIELAQAMRRVTDPLTARDLAQRGLARVAQRFTPRVVAASLESAFRQAATSVTA